MEKSNVTDPEFSRGKLEESLLAMENHLDRAVSLRHRVQGIADRLIGPEPQPGESSNKETEPPYFSFLAHFEKLLVRLEKEASNLQNEISRLEKL